MASLMLWVTNSTVALLLARMSRREVLHLAMRVSSSSAPKGSSIRRSFEQGNDQERGTARPAAAFRLTAARDMRFGISCSPTTDISPWPGQTRSGGSPTNIHGEASSLITERQGIRLLVKRNAEIRLRLDDITPVDLNDAARGAR